MIVHCSINQNTKCIFSPKTADHRNILPREGGIVLNRRFVCFLILILLAGTAVRAQRPSEVPVADYIRLHVLAEDDSDEAQALKLKVRDACLEAARTLLADCDSADEAWTLVCDNLDGLEAAAADRARELGYIGPVVAETGLFDFPDRHYGGVFVPAGQYRALRVVIGAGEGHNWWCVLYPSLCLPEGVDPNEPIRFHSVILDWLRGLLGGEKT